MHTKSATSTSQARHFYSWFFAFDRNETLEESTLKRRTGTIAAIAVFVALCGVPLTSFALPSGFNPMQAAASAPTRVMGTVTAVGSNTLTVKPSSGNAVTVTVGSSTRIMRLEPGQKSLSQATPIQLTDISTGDRALVSATAGADNALTANLIVAMKASDIAARQHAEEEEWQQNGVGGIVKSVDAASNTIVLASTTHDITINVPASTSIREYAENSVAFQNSHPSTLAAIQPGDQLRARGPHSADDKTVTAKAIVFGDFQNIAGVVLSVDSSAKTLTLKNLATHKPVTLAVNADSTLRQLPQRVAEFVAMRLHAMKQGGESAGQAGAGHNRPHREGEGQMAAQQGAGGGFSRVMAHATPIQLSDLHKGDAVMVVASKGSNNQPGTALTLLSGVAPMLRASRKASQSLFSSSWSLGGGGGQSSSGGGQSSSGAQGSSGGQNQKK